MDHGSLGEEALSRPDPLLDHARARDGSDLDPRSRSPRPLEGAAAGEGAISASPFAAANLHAFSANARAPETAAADHDRDDPLVPADPADFYRSFQAQSAQAANASPPVDDPMAPALAASSRRAPSLRSNGGGTTPKHPPPTSTQRGGVRPPHRSVSNPVDGRLGGATAAAGRPSLTAGSGYGAARTAPPSVKDLKKKFDQSALQPTSSVRKPPSRTSSRDTTSNGLGRRSSAAGGSGAASHGAPGTTPARDAEKHGAAAESGSALPPQRPQFVTGYRLPSHSESFASRIARPRAAVSSDAPASSQTSGAATEAADAQLSPPRQNGRLLFGEILPGQSDPATPGFGIASVRPRRTSESAIPHPVRPQPRTLSDPDIEPPSPTDWYRAADPGALSNLDLHSSRIPKSHSRAHSDLSGSKLALLHPDYGTTRPDRPDRLDRLDTGSPISPSSPASSTSRLPRLAKKANDTSDAASPVSTRSSSPSAFRSPTASGRSSRQNVSKIPSGISSPRTKASAQTTGAARKAAPSNLSTQTNSRQLNAYVSVPPPKLSPSLRSSRPRQSVATATTAASRMRAVERGSSPARQSLRSPAREGDSAPRRRKVSVGAIDFAQRRESIKLAYSKSVRESQVREAKQAAAEKRRKEVAAASSRAKAEAEAEAAAAAAANAASASAPAGPEPPGEASDSCQQSEEAAADKGAPGTEVSRTAESPAPPQTPTEESRDVALSSLRLEIPGRIQNTGSPLTEGDDFPLSAVTTTTAVTEFDTEPQTEPPRQERTAVLNDALGVMVPGSVQAPSGLEIPGRQFSEQTAASVPRRRPSYPSPSDEGTGAGDSVSIKISLDPTSGPEQQPSPQLTPTRTDFKPESATVPPAAEDDEYVPRPYAFPSKNYGTTVRILGPENDFRPLHKDEPCTTMPTADLRQADEGPLASAPEPVGSGASQSNDARPPELTIDIENLDRIEDFYIGSRLRDDIAVLRGSTFTFDSGTPSDGQPPSAGYQKTPDMSHSLTVPGLLAPGNRLSQHSAWTDFSFASEDRDADCPSPTCQSSHEQDCQDERFRIIPSTGDHSTCASSRGELTQSPEISPLNKSGAASPSVLPEFPTTQHSLPEPGTGKTSEAQDEPGSVRTAAASERNPPGGPPSSQAGLGRDSSLYLAASRPGSFACSHDERESPSGVASPRDSASYLRPDSLEHSRVSLGEALCEKQTTPLTKEEQEEQKRLRQRRLVIQELIDTEDAFIRDMTVVEEIYKGTAEACPNLDSKTIKLIFRNTDEIIAFHAALLVEFKEGASTVYTPKGRRSPLAPQDPKDSDSAASNSLLSASRPDKDDEKDRLTSLGPVFTKNIEQLKAVHEVYLRSSDSSAKRLLQIQEDETVMLWLDECNEVAKELTTAWNLDSLLIKPMQRITKYPDIITHMLKYTPDDHPDREALISARSAVIKAIDEINRTKKNFELVGQIVNSRKRKESDVRAGLARAFGKRVDKLQASGVKTAEDEEYLKLQQQFGDDYLRLQVVLRDVEYYTRNVATYVHEFLQYLSSMELVMRLQPSRDYAHLESKWVQFNVSMRDIEKVALEKHVSLDRFLVRAEPSRLFFFFFC